MVELNKYPIPSEAATANYDYQELASGAGYKTWYFSTATGDTGYLVLSEVDIAPSGSSSGDITINSPAGDWDTSEFNLPRKIKGDVLVSYKNQATATVGERFTLIHVDAEGTETTIGAQVDTGTSGTSLYRTIIWKNVNKQIKKGEKIRVSVEATGASHPIRTSWSSSEATPWTLKIPFNIDL